MQAQEKVVKDRLQSDASGESKALSLQGDWHQPLETRGDDYTVVSQVEDAQDCFNVNNLLAADDIAQGQNAPAVPEKPRKEQIVEQLLTGSGLSSPRRTRFTRSWWTIWMAIPPRPARGRRAMPGRAWCPPGQPANQMMRTIAEITLLPAFPATAYRKVSTLLCALPDTASKVDVNTLKPGTGRLTGRHVPRKNNARRCRSPD